MPPPITGAPRSRQALYEQDAWVQVEHDVHQTGRSVDPTDGLVGAARADVLNNLAWTLATAADVRMRDLDEAVRFAKRSTEIKPTDDTAWNTLARSW